MNILKMEVINKYIKRISSGHREAIDSLFSYSSDNMRAVAQYYCKSSSDVDEVLGDLYMNIVKYSASFDAKKNGYNWMVQITKNLSFNYNKQTFLSVDIDNLDNYLYDDTDSDKLLTNLIVQEAIGELTADEKELIKLLYWEGYTPKEIAAKQSAPLSTLYSRIDVIHKKLKKFIIDS